MNPYGQTNFLDSARYFFQQKSILPRLIILNIAIFAIVHLVNLFLWLFQTGFTPETEGISLVTQWLSVPSLFENLLVKPWSIVTYMFLHQDFLHLLFNMMILFSGGSIFLQYLSEKQLLQTYLIGGLFGALLPPLFVSLKVMLYVRVVFEIL